MTMLMIELNYPATRRAVMMLIMMMMTMLMVELYYPATRRAVVR